VHEARLEGEVLVPALAGTPFALENGLFTLMEADPAQQDARATRYRGSLRGEDGVARTFEAAKTVRNDPGFDSLADVTTIFVTITAADEVAKGVATMPTTELVRSLRSLEVTNARSARERLEATERFTRLCLGPLFEIYASRS
jgi:hypothetical protein